MGRVRVSLWATTDTLSVGEGAHPCPCWATKAWARRRVGWGALGGTLGSRVTHGGWSGDNVLLWGNGAMREKSSPFRRLKPVVLLVLGQGALRFVCLHRWAAKPI